MGLGKFLKRVGGVALGAAGTAIGGYFGGPVGAKIGGAIGGNLLGGGGGGGGTKQGNTANGAYFDYFGPSRTYYGDQLNTLMGANGVAPIAAQDTASTYKDWRKIAGNKGKANYNTYVEGFKPTAASPGMSGVQAAVNNVLNSPGYMGGLKSGEQTLSRNLARTGQVASGAEQIAYGNLGQDYFRKSYQDLFNQYSSLSGATQQPLNMASANQLGADQSRLADQATGQMIGAIGSIFNSTSQNSGVSSNPAGYASGANTYTPTDQTGYMPGYGTPNVSDTSVYSPAQSQAAPYMGGWGTPN
jgi:hypothetical protein